jgi:hypothetical protein
MGGQSRQSDGGTEQRGNVEQCKQSEASRAARGRQQGKKEQKEEQKKRTQKKKKKRRRNERSE